MGAVASVVLSAFASEIAAKSSPAAGLAGIVFDVPDVIYDATLWRRWLFQLLGRMRVASSYEDFHNAWEGQLADVNCGRREFGEALQTFLLGYGLSWAQIDEVEAASRIQRQTLEVEVRPLPGVGNTIRALNRLKIPLVAWADVPLTGAKLAERLERIVPRSEFQVVATSFETECCQPDRHCYLVMQSLLAASSGRLLYVGHDAAHLAAARQAGMLTAALSYLSTGDVDYPLPRLENLSEVALQLHQAASAKPPLIPQLLAGRTALPSGECR